MTCIVADVVVTNLYFGTKVLTFLLLPKLFALKFSVVRIKLFPLHFINFSHSAKIMFSFCFRLLEILDKFLTLGKNNVFFLLSLTRNFRIFAK